MNSAQKPWIRASAHAALAILPASGDRKMKGGTGGVSCQTMGTGPVCQRPI